MMGTPWKVQLMLQKVHIPPGDEDKFWKSIKRVERGLINHTESIKWAYHLLVVDIGENRDWSDWRCEERSFTQSPTSEGGGGKFYILIKLENFRYWYSESRGVWSNAQSHQLSQNANSGQSWLLTMRTLQVLTQFALQTKVCYPLNGRSNFENQ